MLEHHCSNKNPCWKILVKKCFEQKSLLKNPTGFFNKELQQGFSTRICNKDFSCSNKNVPTKMFHQKCSNKFLMFQQKCSNKMLPTKMFQQKLPTKIFHQKCSIKNVPTKMFQQISSNKDFPAKIFQQGFTTRQQGFLTIISNKDFSTRIFNPCWKILVEKSLLKNPCCKILVEKSLLKILVGNPCWKIQGFFNKDFSTRNNNKDLQQWFATRIFNVPTKMFHQKCTNKNVPTKVANKNLPTRIFQQGFFNKDLQQGNKDF